MGYTLNGMWLLKVGGFVLSHQSDMRKIAPLWLKFTEDVRADPDAWNLTGDVYATAPGIKPWISEMYGYVFAAATANIWHKIDEHAMIYPTYVTDHPPKILHYGLRFNISTQKATEDFQFDKHREQHFNPLACPPWNGSNESTERGLMSHPPHPKDLKTRINTKKRYVDLLAIETVNTLNEAFCKRHLQRCQLSTQLIEECYKVRECIALNNSVQSRVKAKI